MENIITPKLRYYRYLYEKTLNSYVNPNVLWLDVGCGSNLLPSWRLVEEKKIINNCKKLVGIDYDQESLKKNKLSFQKIRANCNRLPFKNDSFDLVTANMVVEHLDNPKLCFKEIHRILKPNGFFIFHTSNIYGYTTIMARLIPKILKDNFIYLFEGRKKEDVFPTYYMANTESKIRELAKLNGYKIKEINAVTSSAQFIIIPPIVILELIWLRILMAKSMELLRTSLIVILRKS